METATFAMLAVTAAVAATVDGGGCGAMPPAAACTLTTGVTCGGLGAPFAPTRADRDVLRQYLYRTHESELAHTTSFCDFLMLILHHASQKLVQWYPSGRSSVCGS